MGCCCRGILRLEPAEGELRLATYFHWLPGRAIDQVTITERLHQLHCDAIGTIVAADGIIGGHRNPHDIRFFVYRHPILAGVAGADREYERALTRQNGIDDRGISSTTAAEYDDASQ